MKNVNKIKNAQALRRRIRTRAKIQGTDSKPRLSVFRSLLHVYVQAIDDVNSVTLVTASDKELKSKGTKSEIALQVGELMGKKLAEKNIKEAVFDKGAYKYHGRVKALAEGIRKSNIKF